MPLRLANIGNKMLAGLRQADFNSLEAHLQDVYLDHNTVINEPGSSVENVFFPTGAIFSVITIMADGQGVEVCTIGLESGYGLLNVFGSTLAIDRVIVQVPGSCLKIARSRMKPVVEASPHLAALMTRHVQANLAQTQQSVACNALHHVEARLCRWLLMSVDRTNNGALPLTQEFLGFMLGVQRTTVTGAARALQSAGLIRYVRGKIEILDREGLEEGACECYAVVRDKYDQLSMHSED